MLATNGVSRAFGKFATTEFPKPIQSFINWSYVALLGLDMSEFQKPSKYRSLNKLFTRELRKKRELEKGFLSPTDSLITDSGEISEERAYQIKGMSYSTDELLSDKIEVALKHLLNGGEFINFYLSPKDYHHYHSPFDLQISRVVHIPGKLYPVNIPYLKKKQNLFIENERVVIECYTKERKLLYFVLVGALNVGKIHLSFEPKLQTNIGGGVKVYEYDNISIAKGEDLGYFEMGSTVVILAEHGFLRSDVRTGQKVKFGQKVAEVL
jgi:phosphatidylserine decarboxylase